MKEIPKKFSVDQAHTIAMDFFLGLWPLVEPRIRELENRTGTYSLFFLTVPTDPDPGSAEWNEAIRRFMQIPKEEQRSLQLSLHRSRAPRLEDAD